MDASDYTLLGISPQEPVHRPHQSTLCPDLVICATFRCYEVPVAGGHEDIDDRPLPGGVEIETKCSWAAREKIGEVTDLLVGDGVEDFRHRGVVAAPRIVLIFAQRLHEVVLTLAGEPWDILGAGKI
jgi:hypothetical protein